MSKQSQFNRALEYISAQVTTGEIESGTHLTESSISKALDISRGPIREALKTLASEGMLEYSPNKGYRVIELTPEDSWEVFFLRGQLERIALEVRGGKLSLPCLMTMESALSAMKEAQENQDADGMSAADEEFHAALVADCNIKRLTQLWRSLSPFSLSIFYSGQRDELFNLEGQWENHCTMNAILAKGDLQASTEAILQHYMTSGKKIYQKQFGQ